MSNSTKIIKKIGCGLIKFIKHLVLYICSLLVFAALIGLLETLKKLFVSGHFQWLDVRGYMFLLSFMASAALIPYLIAIIVRMAGKMESVKAYGIAAALAVVPVGLLMLYNDTSFNGAISFVQGVLVAFLVGCLYRMVDKKTNLSASLD